MALHIGKKHGAPYKWMQGKHGIDVRLPWLLGKDICYLFMKVTGTRNQLNEIDDMGNEEGQWE
jgi:hypothetical protein